MADGRPLRIVVLGPHVEPDTAPTGRVLSRIVTELAARGHELHVVAALPWYRRHAIEPGWSGRLVRREPRPWGTIRRVHPFPGDDKGNLVRRAAGFAGFSVLAAWAGVAAGGRFRRVDAVISMSPPLTLGLTGRLVAWTHRAPLVFNIQDVFPDAAVETGAITDRRIIAVATWLERLSYRLSDAVTVLSDDLRANVTAKVGAPRAGDGPHDPELRRHGPHRTGRSDDAVPRGARHRAGAGRPVRRQHRVLAVGRAAARGGPRPAPRHVPRQR